MNKKSLIKLVKSSKGHSAWSQGVKTYALELIENLGDMREYPNSTLLKKGLLNGAPSISDYSYGGCSLIYDGDIAERLCNPTELKRTSHGQKEPNARESWLDVQARALYQAMNLVIRCYKSK